MFVIVTYDIDTESGNSRLRKVSKICERYGYRVQKSVFELNIDPSQLTLLLNELSRAINSKSDSIRVYKCGKSMKGNIEIIGHKGTIEVADDSAFFL